MNCNIETRKNYDTPAIAGNFRILLGLAALFIGIYLAAFSEIQGHGIGFLLIIGSPFMILTDER